MLHPASAQRIGSLLLVVDADPPAPRSNRAQAIYLAFFLLAAIHAHSISGSLATSASVTPWKDGSNQEVYGMQHKNRFGAMAGAIALSLAGASTAQDAVEWRVVDGGNGHWYSVEVVPAKLDWGAARAEAQALGGDLATLTTAAENAFVFARTQSTAGAWPSWGSPYPEFNLGPWLGAYQEEPVSSPLSNWRWVTDEPWEFTNWGGGQPDASYENYLHFYCGTSVCAAWNNAHFLGYYGDGIRSYVVEWSADCNGDGIVDFGQIRAGELADANGNNIPDCCEGSYPCGCAGDIVPDGVIDGVDLAAVLNQWGGPGDAEFSADTDGNGVVDGGDLAMVLNGWGACR